ncbi:hypothetical protein RS030_101618 [Cryptosporidium xiaoi]|uniref:Uncharacterized protein n=1 Tax=Cryptosporidium xiaoi TaxID=659607 RepID=A0AAV9Y2R0_9CRYT
MNTFKTIRLLGKLFSITTKSIHIVTKRYIKDFYKDRIKKALSFNIRKRMTLNEAKIILGLSQGLKYSKEDIKNIAKRMFELNETSGKYRGSPYIQEKILIAKKLIIEELIKKSKLM